MSIRAVNFVTQPRFSYPNASPCLMVGEGEALGNKDLRITRYIVAQMLLPYIIDWMRENTLHNRPLAQVDFRPPNPPILGGT
jgi:hypothetical protein